MFGVKKRKGRFEAPHVFVILFTLIIAASIMTYLIPAGHFERVELGGRMVIDPESFVYVEQTPVGIFAALNCITAGIGEVSEIIAFLLIMGGSFHVIGSICSGGRRIWHGGGNASIYRNYGNPGNVHGL